MINYTLLIFQLKQCKVTQHYKKHVLKAIFHESMQIATIFLHDLSE